MHLYFSAYIVIVSTTNNTIGTSAAVYGVWKNIVRHGNENMNEQLLEAYHAKTLIKRWIHVVDSVIIM